MVKQSILMARVAVLLLILPTSNVWAGWWRDQSISSNEKPLCQELYERLKNYTWVSANEFWTIVATDPELTEPPWQDLIPSEHKELLQRLTAYRQLGRDKYFDKINPVDYVSVDEFYDVVIKQPVYEGARLQIWKSRFSEVYEQGERKAPPGEQTIVQWRTPINWNRADPKNPHLRNVPRINWQGASFFVTSDLSGPDKSVDEGAGYILSISSVLIYQGHPFLFQNSGSVFHFNEVVGIEKYCDFKFHEGKK